MSFPRATFYTSSRQLLIQCTTFSPSTCFSTLSPGERAEETELWESSGRQLWFQLPVVTQLQRDGKVKGSMLNRRLFTWLRGGDDQPLIKHCLLESAGHAIGTGTLIENSRHGAAAFDFSTQLGITFPSTEKAIPGQKSSLSGRKCRNISLYLLFSGSSCLIYFL